MKFFLDFYIFTMIVLYWIFVVLVMLPLKYADKIFGTDFLDKAIKFTKYLGNL